MIELKQVKVFPLHNPNMIISNVDELSDMIKGVCIIKDFDYENRQGEQIIGMISKDSQVKLEDRFLTADIIIQDEYKDYLFKNYQVQGEFEDDGLYRFDRIACIEFGRSE